MATHNRMPKKLTDTERKALFNEGMRILDRVNELLMQSRRRMELRTRLLTPLDLEI